jgi:hypothetical protein
MPGYISSRIEEVNGKYEAFWQVDAKNGKATFDTYQEADEYIQRNINRETGFKD